MNADNVSSSLLYAHRRSGWTTWTQYCCRCLCRLMRCFTTFWVVFSGCHL